MKADLHLLAYKIFKFIRKHKITLAITWIPRDSNQRADFYSKIMDFDDWFVSDFWFDFIMSRFGLPDIDRFADSDNARCSQFNSRYYYPGSSAVDSFTQHWGGVLNWLVPPIFLIIRTINHLEFCKARGILVVPLWRSAQFWPILKNHLNNSVVTEACM